MIAGWDGPVPPRGLERLIAAGGVAGVILFADNIVSRRQARRTIAALQSIDRPKGLEAPLLVMVDQEGGQVKRLEGAPERSAEAMGTGDSAAAEAEGRATADSLRSLGINVDLAPVLDLARPGGAIASEQRSFGAEPDAVVELAIDGFWRGLRAGGVAAAAKHFPGLGAARLNTDRASQRIDLSAERLRAFDEVPFGAFNEAGGELVMVSLATYPAFSDRPAAFSRSLVSGELRGRLGFEGVTITDGLGAAAAAAFGTRGEVAEAAIDAGEDLLLYTDWRDSRDVGRQLTRKLRREELSLTEFETAVDRVMALRAKLAPTSSPASAGTDSIGGDG